MSDLRTALHNALEQATSVRHDKQQVEGELQALQVVVLLLLCYELILCDTASVRPIEVRYRIFADFQLRL
jgi:hypothetical protein